MNVRLSALLVLVLVLVGGSVFVTRELSTKEPTKEEDLLFKVDMSDIVGITVTHEDKTVSYALTGDQWVIKDGKDTPVFRDKWLGTTLLLSGPRSSRTVAQTLDDPTKYGLEPPKTTVEIVERSGFPLSLHLGDPTPNGEGWYFRLAGSDNLYTVASSWGEVVTKLATEPPYPPTPTPQPAPG